MDIPSILCDFIPPHIAALRFLYGIDPVLRLPCISLPLWPAVPLALNPSLVMNLGQSVGPAKRNAKKMDRGIKCLDAPVCTIDSHETNRKRKNAFRSASECRGCLKNAIGEMPSTATRWQVVRFLTAKFRNYFCPFCLLESDKKTMHLVSCKASCKSHSAVNRKVTCKHDKPWQYCKECEDDPRSSTFYCACGKSLSGSTYCVCPEDKRKPYGIRLHTDPFVVPTDCVRAKENGWAVQSIAQATHEEIQPSQKKQRKSAGVALGPYITPRI
jgi:hypothetical protein